MDKTLYNQAGLNMGDKVLANGTYGEIVNMEEYQVLVQHGETVQWYKNDAIAVVEPIISTPITEASNLTIERGVVEEKPKTMEFGVPNNGKPTSKKKSGNKR